MKERRSDHDIGNRAHFKTAISALLCSLVEEFHSDSHLFYGSWKDVVRLCVSLAQIEEEKKYCRTVSSLFFR